MVGDICQSFSEIDFAFDSVPRRGCGNSSVWHTLSNLTTIMQGGHDETVLYLLAILGFVRCPSSNGAPFCQRCCGTDPEHRRHLAIRLTDAARWHGGQAPRHDGA